ncbi:cell division protein DedD, partial [Klebsiella pneumoniae]
AATQALPTQPPEGAAEEVRAGDAAAPSLDPSRMASNNVELDTIPVETPKPKPVEKPKPQPKPQQPVVAASTPTPAPQPVADDKPAPTGKAY